MQKWAESIKTVEDELVRLAIIAANNHYAGFGPGTANIFRNMLGLPEATWRNHDKHEGNSEPQKVNSKQSTLSDFLG
jgi:hypothetical protein